MWKETIYANLVFQCKGQGIRYAQSTRQSFIMSCQVFCLNSKDHIAKGGSDKCWPLLTRGEGGFWKPPNLADIYNFKLPPYFDSPFLWTFLHLPFIKVAQSKLCLSHCQQIDFIICQNLEILWNLGHICLSMLTMCLMFDEVHMN